MMQLPLSFAVPETNWAPPRLADLPSWSDAKRVSLDLETCDPGLKALGPGAMRDGYVVGYSFAIEDGPCYYVPLRHAGGGNVDPLSGLQYLRDQARNFSGVLVGANLQYELEYCAAEIVTWDRAARFADVLLAEPLIDELQLSYSLSAVAARRGLPGKDERVLREAAAAYGVDPKSGLWKLPASYVGPYAEQDARLPHQILRQQEREISSPDQWGNTLESVWKLESGVLPALVRMRRRGVAVDMDRLEELERWSDSVVAEEMAKVAHLTGVRIGPEHINQSAALGPALEKIGIVVPRTGKTGAPSVTKEILEAHKHPVCDAIRRAREFDKLKTTFCASIRRHVINGRIHCSFNQLRRSKDSEDGDSEGTRWGRLSSAKPNLQQQPIRNKEFGARWRGIYRPDPGCEWASLDFSQQEPRIFISMADQLGLPGASDFARKYREDPSTDFHNLTAAASGLDRKSAKGLGLGLLYEMGGSKLCRTLGLPTVLKPHPHTGELREYAGPEGDAVIKQFLSGVPFLKQLSRMCQEAVKEKGYIRTLLGRHCRFTRDSSGNIDWLYTAMNRYIQGSAADQTKAVLVAADKAGFPIQLQVHDELDYSAPSREDAERLAELMRETVKLRVPNRVDLEMGTSWGEIK